MGDHFFQEIHRTRHRRMKKGNTPCVTALLLYIEHHILFLSISWTDMKKYNCIKMSWECFFYSTRYDGHALNHGEIFLTARLSLAISNG